MSFTIILKQMVVIALLASIGYVAFRRKMIDSNMTQRLSVVVVDICNPALSLSCVIQDRLSAAHKDILQAVLIAAVIYLILIALGVVLPKILGIPKAQQKFYHMMTVYANTGFIGIPVARAILEPDAMLYVIIFNVMFSVFFYTHGIYVLGKDKSGKKPSPINMGLICSIATILIAWFDLTVPDLLGEVIVYIGNATAFLSMLLLGASFAVVSFRDVFRGKRIYLYVLLRQLCIPVLFGKILLQMGVQINMVYAFTLLLAMPAANTPLMLASKNGEDTTVLSQGILLTTILSLATVTIVMSVL